MREAFEMAAGMPWLITEGGLERILAIAGREDLDAGAVQRVLAAREASPEAVTMRGAERLPGTARASLRDGVAVLPVTGPIMRYASMFSAISGATSTAGIVTDFQAAVDAQQVHAIVVHYDSPGGEATGIAELAEEMKRARGTKPIIAYVGDMAASAAYWLACSADEVVLSPTAVVGSIGAVMRITDTSQRDAASGVRRNTIVSSSSPRKGVDPTSREGQDQILSVVDALAEQFIASVAAARGVSVDTVASDFGKGGLVPRAADAVRLKMADRIGTLEGLIRELRTKGPPASRPAISSALPSPSRLPMPALSTTSDDYTRGLAAGAKAERERCQAILNLPEAAAQLDEAKRLAFATDVTPAVAVELLRYATAEQSGKAGPSAASQGPRTDETPYYSAGGTYAPCDEAKALARSALASAGIEVAE